MENSSVIKKQKLSSRLEQRLLSTKKYHQSWWIIFGLTLFYLLLTAAVLLAQFFPYDPKSSTAINLQLNHTYALASQILVYISYGIFAIPYLYFIGAWISGINNISRSKTFHLTIWIIYAIIYGIALIAIFLCIRSVLL